MHCSKPSTFAPDLTPKLQRKLLAEVGHVLAGEIREHNDQMVELLSRERNTAVLRILELTVTPLQVLYPAYRWDICNFSRDRTWLTADARL